MYSDYSITGYVYKNHFLNGHDVIVKSLKKQDTIITGNYIEDNNYAFIKGLKKRSTKDGIIYSKGLFKVSNSKNAIGFTVKPKKADSIQIQIEDFSFIKEFNNDYTSVLQKLSDSNYLYVKDFTKSNFNVGQDEFYLKKMEININKSIKIKHDSSIPINDYIDNSTNKKMTFSDGRIFFGKVLFEDGNAVYKEGKFIYSSGYYDEMEIIKLGDGNYLLIATFSGNQSHFYKKSEITIDKKLIEKYGYWKLDEILNDDLAKSEDYVKYKLIYFNNDIFIGKYNGLTYCSYDIEGKTIFTDGTFEHGNWLEKYNLSNDDQAKVSELYPTEARNIAQNIYINRIKNRKYNEAISNAKYELTNENFFKAKEWYSKAKMIDPNKSDYIDYQITKINIQIKHKALIDKYGDYYANKIINSELTLGMSQTMVNEIYSKKYFNISTSSMNNYLTEIWEFDKEKMQREFIKEMMMKDGEKGGESAVKSLLVLELAEQFGSDALEFPYMLVFIDNKLTHIYN